jgi:hypothetical protein
LRLQLETRMDGTLERSHIGVRCYPITDEHFTAEVQAVVASWSEGDLTATALGNRLADSYPAIKVVAQEPLAALGSRPVLYVYRDGHP